MGVILNLKGAKGDAGDPGAKGDQGNPGAAGTKWYSGTGAPSDGVGVDNDYYLNTTTGDVYMKASGTWS